MVVGRGILTEKCEERDLASTSQSVLFEREGAQFAPEFATKKEVNSRWLFQCLQARAQAGLVAASRVLVQHALLNSFVQSRDRRAEALFGGGLIALGQGRAHIAQGRA